MSDSQAVYNPLTGKVEKIAPEALARAKETTGARPMSDAEVKAFTEAHKPKTYGENLKDELIDREAKAIGQARGAGEVVGLPTDEAAVSIADIFGQKEPVRRHLLGLKEEHPLSSALGEFGGQAGAGIAGGELLGAGEAPAAVSRLGRVAAGAGRGGLENVIIGNTSDLNEAALGDQKANGEKMWAALPKHFGIGVGAGTVFGALGEGVGALASGVAAKGPAALERRATALVGSELGGDAALGARVRAGFDGGVPSSTEEIASVFGREQARARGAARDARAAAVEGVRAGHAAEAADLEGRHASQAYDAATGYRPGGHKPPELVQDALDALAERHGAERDALIAKRAEAADVADGIAAERAKNADQLKTLATDLDKVKGAELPKVSNVLQEAAQEPWQMRIASSDLDAGLRAPAERAHRPISITDDRPLGAADLPAVIKRLETDGELTPEKLASVYHRSGTSADEVARIVDEALQNGPTQGPFRPQRAGMYRSVYRNEKLDEPEFPAMLMSRNASDAAAPGVADALAAPPSPAAQKAFAAWTGGFKKLFPDGEVPFVKMGEVIGSLESMAKNTRDPATKKSFAGLLDAARAEFDRASEATAAGVSDASHLSAQRLRDLAPDLEKAHDNAIADVAKHDQILSDFEKTAASEQRQAQVAAAEARGDFARQVATAERDLGKTQKAEAGELGKRQKAEEKAIPKATKETEVDDIVAAAGAEGETPKPSFISPSAALGFILSLAHGNVVGAGLSAAGGLAAGFARAEGNLGAAKVLHAIADRLAGVDQAIKRGAGRVLKSAFVEGGTRAAAGIVEEAEKSRAPTYEKVVDQVRAANANPAILEAHVRKQLGPIASAAPQLYASTLETAQRSQAFLNAAIPASRRDPYSPTAHLEPDDVSDAERYDYMSYVSAIRDPVSVLRNAADGDVTDRDIAAVEYVYPELYGQMKSELQRNVQALQRPIDYMAAVHLGTLFQEPTSEAMEPAFQSAQAQMYAARAKDEQVPGKPTPPAGPNARMSKANMSGSQQVESGEGQ